MQFLQKTHNKPSHFVTLFSFSPLFVQKVRLFVTFFSFFLRFFSALNSPLLSPKIAPNAQVCVDKFETFQNFFAPLITGS